MSALMFWLMCYIVCLVIPAFTTQSTSSSGWSGQPSARSPAVGNTTVMPPPSSASRGTNLFNTSYNLTYIDDPKTWIKALQHCRDRHKTLVHIVNSTVQEYITQMLQGKIYPNGVWIGLERNMLFPCAPWMWTGGPYVNYSEWNSSFPVDPTSQYCGKLVGNGSKWLDSYCSEELPFICQD
ncbi:lithostathine-1-beta [Pygocentrus nattereri]|uniref:lithostathine-1-beta n=1 Tax=Pygocentrus nattereri TaxID=42514 RepID=UPI0008144853|nr:lithostathine-1-beta [Pygocentrus nattereri]